MNKTFTELDFPDTLKISSTGEMIPLQFFGQVIPLCKKIQFKLGFFSTNSIKTLYNGFARFIYNGGTIDFLINHFVSEEDYQLLNNNLHFNKEFYEKIENEILTDLEKLSNVLQKKKIDHFFNCLRYLLDKGRLNIIPVKTKTGEVSHYKEALFWDKADNVINIVGSCNFTYKGLVCNGESFLINRSWGSKAEAANIAAEIKDYDEIFAKKSSKFIYLDPSDLTKIIYNRGKKREVEHLLEDELKILEDEHKEVDFLKIEQVLDELKDDFENILEEIRERPHFPNSNEPYPYQKEAYENWVNNNRKGLFAMATGTGKTITSLNCILEDYKLNNYYKFIVLVPTIPLANQWQNETVEKFNFSKTVLCSSKNKGWEDELKRIAKKIKFRENPNYCIILTYATFKTNRFQEVIKILFETEFDKITLIADECHAMGSSGLLHRLPNYIQKRIGLSATPSRQFDEDGDKVISEFFDSFPPLYTYRYDMKKAIENEVLCKYYYFPRFVELEKDELSEYIKISEKLIKFFDSETGRYKDDPIVTNLLIKRKNVIHKARQKLQCLTSIIAEIGADNFKNAFVYVPEGIEYDYENADYFDPEEDELSTTLIHKYAKELYTKFKLRLRTFTGNTLDRDEIINQFKDERLDALLAMKCLDEGIDIPQTQLAIFCASTGNPRQYIQRRGRVLRRYKGKEHSIIYDMIVKPNFDPTFTNEQLIGFEKNIFKSELKRIINFAVLAENQDVILDELEQLALYCGENIYELAKKEYENFE